MTLHIKDGKGFGVVFWLPTSLLKSKFILKNIKKHCDTDIEPLIDLLPTINKSLKDYYLQQETSTTVACLFL